MRIGFPTNPRKNIYTEIDWIADNNFDFVDLFIEADLNEVDKIDSNKLSRYIADKELKMVGHTAWYLPIGSPLKELRHTAVEILEKHIIFFDSLNCNKMTIHSNWPGGMFSAQEGIEFQTDSLRKILNFAKDFDVQIMLEPIATHMDSLSNIEILLNNNENLFFHLDVGHANLFNRNPLEFIKLFKDKLLHIHLHDNNGRADLHNPLGTGNVHWKGIIKELKTFYTETITLEIFSNNKNYVLMSKEMLNKELQRIDS